MVIVIFRLVINVYIFICKVEEILKYKFDVISGEEEVC